MDPPPITDGLPEPITGATAPYALNDVITYSCATNYVLDGMRTNVCLGPPSFEWLLMENDVPRCIRGAY